MVIPKERLQASAVHLGISLCIAAAAVALVSRQSAWTAFLDPQTAEIVGFMPLDSF